MKTHRLAAIFLLVVVFLIIVSGTAVAAPIIGGQEQALLMSEKAAINLPGWLGGTLTIIALALPLAFWVWMRQK